MWLVAFLLVIVGVGLIGLSVSRWWIKWLDRKGGFLYWIVQIAVLFFGIWGLFKGGTWLLSNLFR